MLYTTILIFMEDVTLEFGLICLFLYVWESSIGCGFLCYLFHFDLINLDMVFACGDHFLPNGTLYYKGTNNCVVKGPIEKTRLEFWLCSDIIMISSTIVLHEENAFFFFFFNLLLPY